MNNSIIVELTEEEKKIVNNNHYKKNETHDFFDFSGLVCEKPWGHEFLIYQNEKIGIWFLKINHGHKTSLHCHFNKDTFIIVLKGSVKIELIGNKVLNLNCLQSIFLPHYNFHGIGSFSDESYIIEIEIYNSHVNYTDKDDLLRINDQYHRPNNKYLDSVSLIQIGLEKYNYFCLSNGFNENICGIDMKLCSFSDCSVEKIYELKKSNYNILLDGVIYTDNGKYIKEGSLLYISDLKENIKFLEDKITILSLEKYDYEDENKIIYCEDQLKIVVDKLKKSNKEIVLSSGCFDILHVGHIKNLIEAKKKGDILMVCLSNDEQIKKLKGETRPINNYQDRIDLFKTIKYVDYVILYSENCIETEETLGEIMKIVDPHVWVKGSDYKVEDILKKHPYLKRIDLIENVKNKSTTQIVNKINNSVT